jgi:hypothetical protein
VRHPFDPGQAFLFAAGYFLAVWTLVSVARAVGRCLRSRCPACGRWLALVEVGRRKMPGGRDHVRARCRHCAATTWQEVHRLDGAGRGPNGVGPFRVAGAPGRWLTGQRRRPPAAPPGTPSHSAPGSVPFHGLS